VTRGTDPDWTENVTIAIPYSSISLVGGFFGNNNYTVTASCSMRTEGTTSGA